MRSLDEIPIDPEVAASLDAIDATLAGEPVDPRHADLAELALLLAAERPSARPEFERALEARVLRRFAAAASPPRSESSRKRAWLGSFRERAWLWAPASALACGIVVAIIVVSGGSTSVPPTSSSASVPSAAPSSGPHRTASSAAGAAGSAGAGSAGAGSSGSSAAGAGAASGSGASQGLTAASQASTAGAALQPPSNGRKTIQGAQLALSTAPSRIDAVAQEVFNVVGQDNGIVQSSSVTASSSPGAYAEFQLSVPSSTLSQAMASLSSLRYARVSSRTDTTQDVNDEYQRDVRKLADARALRTSLLKQLANATTQAQIDSLNAQIHDAEASISSDQATLRQLQHQVDYSQITLTINTPVPVPVPSAGSGGFTLGKAAHDAGRVLTVAAGVALIALAALVPIALVGALGWWITTTIRRRRREQALDLA